MSIYNTYTPPRLGHFIDHALWLDALKLLNFQIDRKKKNKHYNTLSMFYYEQLGPAVQDLASSDYFNDKIANNMFYGLEKEFNVLEYLAPKQGLDLRSYKFFTYPLLTVFNTISIYLLKVSQE